jgi:predicted exporter
LNALPPSDDLRARMTQALQDTPFVPDTFEPFIGDAASAKSQPPLDRSTIEKTPIGAKLDALLIQHDGAWTALLSLRDVTDFAPIAARIAEAGPVGTIAVDLKLESNRLLESYRREAVLLALIGSLAIVALLAVALRSPRRIGVVVAPLAASVLITAAILTAGGHTLSIFNLVGLLLTVAVGSNYCIFVERQDWRDANAPRMLASLVLANACTIIGFGTLAFARLPVLHDIGMTVAIGAVLSLVSAAILTAHQAPEAGEERRAGIG